MNEAKQPSDLTEAREPIIVTLGIENLVVVRTDDALLVCHADRVQDIKKALARLREEGKESYL